jgi:hypothetical protein
MATRKFLIGIYPRIEDQIAEDQQESLKTTPLSNSHLDTFLSKPQNARCEIRKFCENCNPQQTPERRSEIRKFCENRNIRFYTKPWIFNNLELAQ